MSNTLGNLTERFGYRWIAVTERLPEKRGVLHPVILGGEKPKVWMGFMAGVNWTLTPTECEEDDSREVTHWFALPEPPHTVAEALQSDVPKESA